MAKLTKGYPFAFQILGYLKWETNDALEKLLPKFDEELIIYAYEKIWSCICRYYGNKLATEIKYRRKRYET